MLSDTVWSVLGVRLAASVVLAGTLGGCASMGHGGHDADDESSEVEVTRDQLPQATRAALDANLPAGAVVDEIEHDTKEGTYDVEYTLNGKKYEMEIEADGKVEIESDQGD